MHAGLAAGEPDRRGVLAPQLLLQVRHEAEWEEIQEDNYSVLIWLGNLIFVSRRNRTSELRVVEK